MFHPERWPKATWNFVLVILLIYTATIMPVRISFIEAELFSTWFWVDTMVDALFLVDFVVNCFSAYYDANGLIVTRR
jgi:hypothetical protein